MSKRDWKIRLLAVCMSFAVIMSSSSMALAAEQIGLPESDAQEQISEPVAEILEEPSVKPTEEEAPEEATEEPTEEPLVMPTEVPSAVETEEPSVEPIEEPVEPPTEAPDVEEIDTPTQEATEDAMEEPAEESSETPSLEPVEEADEIADEETEKTGNVLEDLPALSEEQLDDKQNLRNHLTKIKGKTEGVDYVANQVIMKAESEELAEKYAASLGGVVTFYGNPFALIELEQSALEVISFTASDDNLLPAAWPNYFGYVGGNHSETESIQENSVIENNVITETNAEADLQGLGQISGYTNTMQSEHHHELVETEVVWNAGHKGSGVIVAILSTGFNSYEGDTSPKISSVSNYSTDEANRNLRGTLYASVIAGSLGDNALLHGIAPESDLVSIRIVNDQGASSDMDVIKAITKSYEYGTDIICLDYVSNGYNQALEEAVNATRDKGVVLFCTAGDSGTNATTYPAAYQYAYGVGALNLNKTRMGRSNYGPSVSFAASGGYEEKWPAAKGTGFATAVVSAQAALLISSGKVTGTGAEFVDNLIQMMKSGSVAAKSTGMGKGIVSVPKCLNLVIPNQKPKKPQFARKAGTYTESNFELTMTCPEDCYIIYTMDGSDVPKKTLSESKRKSSETIHVSGRATTIKARTVNPLTNTFSDQMVATYVLKPNPNSISLNPYNPTILRPDKAKQKRTLKFTATVYPSYAVNKKVTYYIEGNPKGITIDENGLVTVTSKATHGEYTVCAKTKNGIVATRTLYVERESYRDIGSFTLGKSAVTLWANQTVDIPLKAYGPDGEPLEPNDFYFLHNTSDLWVADVTYDEELGVIRIMAEDEPGTAKITVKTQDGSCLIKTVKVTVRMPVTDIILNGGKRLVPGKSITISKILNQGDYAPYNKNVKWSVSPAGQGVTIDKYGKVTASRNAIEGEYTVTCTAKDGQGAYETHKFEVTKNKVTDIQVEKSKVTFLRPYSMNIKTKVTGGDIYSYSVTTNRTDLISVMKRNDGSITIGSGGNFKTGKAIITVKSTDGTNIVKKIEVTVVNAPTNLMISLPAGRTTEVVKGKTLQLSAAFGDDYGKVSTKSKKVKWISSDPKIFKVDKNTGKVTCLANSGTATITCQTTDGSNLKDTITLTAYRDLKSIYLSDRTYELKPKKSTFTINKGTEYNYRVCQVETGAKVTDPVHGRHPMKYKVDKQGLSVKSSADGFDICVSANKAGTYKLTISSADGSKITKTYTIKVK